MDWLPNKTNRWARLGIGRSRRRAMVTASSLKMSLNWRSQSSRRVGKRGLVVGSSDLISASVGQGYPALSLSVREANPARGLYESVGFVPVEKHGTSWTMIRHAARSN